jgi:hypothetical protein
MLLLAAAGASIGVKCDPDKRPVEIACGGASASH